MGIEPMDDNELITKDELEKFKEIVHRDYGIKLTDERAFEQGIAVVSFFEFLIKKRLKINET